jgi:5-methylcytosine-specific restriction endonuclease McrA
MTTINELPPLAPNKGLSGDAKAALDVAREMLKARRPANAGVDDVGKYARFYKSRAWRATRYAFLKTQPRPLRCRCCGATAEFARLVTDHIIAIKVDWSRRLDPTNFQILCNDCNLAKASSDATDWRKPPQTEKESSWTTACRKPSSSQSSSRGVTRNVLS